MYKNREKSQKRGKTVNKRQKCGKTVIKMFKTQKPRKMWKKRKIFR